MKTLKPGTYHGTMTYVNKNGKLELVKSKKQSIMKTLERIYDRITKLIYGDLKTGWKV